MSLKDYRERRLPAASKGLRNSVVKVDKRDRVRYDDLQTNRHNPGIIHKRKIYASKFFTSARKQLYDRTIVEADLSM